jgi:hypothetical protein
MPPNLSDAPDARLPLLSIPLPRFRQPRPPDPALPEVETDGPGPATEASPPSPDHLQQPTPTPGPLPPLDLSPERPAPTRTFSAGDLKVAGEVVAGILALVCGYAAWFAGRRARVFRQPTQTQLDNVATPVGAIVARHVPTEFISRDLVDATRAAGAVHSYLIDGPLIERTPEPMPDFSEDPQ